MRGNIVMVLLVLMLGGFFAALFVRSPEAHEAPPIAAETPEAPPTGTTTTSATVASATATTTAAPAPPKPRMARPLRVVALDWELLAPGVMANGGEATSKKDSAFDGDQLTVELRVEKSVDNLENALARGGEAKEGADIAILPLPRFVASYERLKALSPVIFLTVGWSDGREVLIAEAKSLDGLPARGSVKLQAEAGSPAAMLGLFALDAAGLTPDRVELVDDDKAKWSAVPRTEMKGKGGQTKGHLLLSTGEASHLIPFVAIAQRSMVEKQPEVLQAFARGWLKGHDDVASDASGTARKIATLERAPKPLEVLAALGQIRPASLRDNAQALGLAGRGAATLENLFSRAWSIWRQAKVLTIPPEQAPVDGRVVGALIREGGELEGPAPPKAAVERPDTEGKPLLVRRLEGKKLDEEAAIAELGFLASVFPRCPIRFAVHPGFAIDAKKTEALLEQARERFALSPERITKAENRPKPGTMATIEVMPVP